MDQTAALTHSSYKSATSKGFGLHQFLSDIDRAMKTEKAEKDLLGQDRVNCWQNY